MYINTPEIRNECEAACSTQDASNLVLYILKIHLYKNILSTCKNRLLLHKNSTQSAEKKHVHNFLNIR